MEAFEFSEGKITVSKCNENVSIGNLILKGNEQLERHNRPVDEKLLQIEGTGGIRIFKNGETKEVILEEGDTLTIPADQDHQHFNPTEGKSITTWRFEGDIQDIIQDIRDEHDQL